MYAQEEVDEGLWWRTAEPFMEPQSFLRSFEESKELVKAGFVVTVILPGYLAQEEELKGLLKEQQPGLVYDSGQVPCWYSCRHVSMYRELLGSRVQQAALRPRDPATRCQHLAPVEYARILKMTCHRRTGAKPEVQTSGLFVRLTLQRLIEQEAEDQTGVIPGLRTQPLTCQLDCHLDAAEETFLIKRSYFHEAVHANPWLTSGKRCFMWWRNDHYHRGIWYPGRWYEGVIQEVRDLSVKWGTDDEGRPQVSGSVPPGVKPGDDEALRSPWKQVKVAWKESASETQKWVQAWELRPDHKVKTRWHKGPQPEDWQLGPFMPSDTGSRPIFRHSAVPAVVPTDDLDRYAAMSGRDVQPLSRSFFCAYCHEGGELVTTCAGDCQRAFHSQCIQCVTNSRSQRKLVSSTWACDECGYNSTTVKLPKPICTVCGGGADRGAPVLKCSVVNCPWLYHVDCLRPISNELLGQDIPFSTFACPAHTCAKCRVAFVPGSGVHLRVCWRCPRAYHDACLPEEAERIEGTEEVNTLCECPSCAILYRAARKQLLSQAKVPQQAEQADGGRSTGSGSLTIRDCRVLEDICRQGFQQLWYERQRGEGNCADDASAGSISPEALMRTIEEDDEEEEIYGSAALDARTKQALAAMHLDKHSGGLLQGSVGAPSHPEPPLQSGAASYHASGPVPPAPLHDKPPGVAALARQVSQLLQAAPVIPTSPWPGPPGSSRPRISGGGSLAPGSASDLANAAYGSALLVQWQAQVDKMVKAGVCMQRDRDKTVVSVLEKKHLTASLNADPAALALEFALQLARRRLTPAVQARTHLAGMAGMEANATVHARSRAVGQPPASAATAAATAVPLAVPRRPSMPNGQVPVSGNVQVQTAAMVSDVVRVPLPNRQPNATATASVGNQARPASLSDNQPQPAAATSVADRPGQASPKGGIAALLAYKARQAAASKPAAQQGVQQDVQQGVSVEGLEGAARALLAYKARQAAASQPAAQQDIEQDVPVGDMEGAARASGSKRSHEAGAELGPVSPGRKRGRKDASTNHNSGGAGAHLQQPAATHTAREQAAGAGPVQSTDVPAGQAGTLLIPAPLQQATLHSSQDQLMGSPGANAALDQHIEDFAASSDLLAATHASDQSNDHMDLMVAVGGAVAGPAEPAAAMQEAAAEATGGLPLVSGGLQHCAEVAGREPPAVAVAATRTSAAEPTAPALDRPCSPPVEAAAGTSAPGPARSSCSASPAKPASDECHGQPAAIGAGSRSTAAVGQGDKAAADLMHEAEKAGNSMANTVKVPEKADKVDKAAVKPAAAIDMGRAKPAASPAKRRAAEGDQGDKANMARIKADKTDCVKPGKHTSGHAGLKPAAAGCAGSAAPPAARVLPAMSPASPAARTQQAASPARQLAGSQTLLRPAADETASGQLRSPLTATVSLQSQQHDNGGPSSQPYEPEALHPLLQRALLRRAKDGIHSPGAAKGLRSPPAKAHPSPPAQANPEVNPLSPTKTNPLPPAKANPLSPAKANPLPPAKANPLSPAKAKPLLPAKANPLSPAKAGPSVVIDLTGSDDEAVVRPVRAVQPPAGVNRVREEMSITDSEDD